jgi:hypothetical protein
MGRDHLVGDRRERHRLTRHPVILVRADVKMPRSTMFLLVALVTVVASEKRPGVSS